MRSSRSVTRRASACARSLLVDLDEQVRIDHRRAVFNGQSVEARRVITVRDLFQLNAVDPDGQRWAIGVKCQRVDRALTGMDGRRLALGQGGLRGVVLDQKPDAYRGDIERVAATT